MISDEEDEEVIESLEETIEELNERITEFEEEVESIKEDPEGEFPEELIEEKIDDLTREVEDNPKWFMSEFGLEWEDYIDKDEFIKGVIDEDGYGVVNGYDGNYDEVYVNNVLYYVMRID